MLSYQPPVKKFCAIFAEFTTKIPIEEKKSKNDLTYFFDVIQQLSVAVESKEPEPEIAGDFLKQHRVIHAKVVKQEQDYDAAFLEREKKFAEFESALQEIHIEKIEVADEGLVAKLNNLVEAHKLHDEFDDEIDNLNSAIASECCCLRFFGCCLSQRAKDAQLDIKKLQEEKAQLNSKNPRKKYEAMLRRLDAKRESIEKERAAFSKTKLTPLDRAYQKNEVRIDIKVEHHENKIHDENVMILILRMYEWYQRILKNLPKPSAIKSNEKEPLINPVKIMNDVLLPPKAEIETRFRAFWHRSLDFSGPALHLKFMRLSGTEQLQFLQDDNSELAKTFIPTVSMPTITM